jgi:glutamine synthetase
MDPYSRLKAITVNPKSVIIVEYVWIDGNNNLRSKSRTLPIPLVNQSYLDHHIIPDWSYDGSSTKQSLTKDSDVIIKPVVSFHDPFRGYPNLLVLCDTWTAEGEPLENNYRYYASSVFNDISTNVTKPWYGIEQEMFFLNTNKKPIGFPADGNPEKQGEYYCGVGPNNIFGRDIMEEFYQCCITANIKIAGINAEVANSQWEFQIGPCDGLEAGDHLWTARYILNRVAEKYGVIIDYHPKALGKEWNGSGLHTNFSTLQMREENGINVIKDAINKLENAHMKHMKEYGKDNEMRMTGIHETAHYYTFTWGMRDRSASVRIPPSVVKSNKGYLEDRRPGSNADPYLVTALIYETVVLNVKD